MVTLKAIMGHARLTSTEIYLHPSRKTLRKAVNDHPAGEILADLTGMEILTKQQKWKQKGGQRQQQSVSLTIGNAGRKDRPEERAPNHGKNRGVQVHAADGLSPAADAIVGRNEMKKILPPTYFLAAILIMVALHFLLPLREPISFPWRLLGLAPLTAGIILNILADRAFKIHRTTVKPFQKSSALVTEGVFRISRHPMYLGMILILTGIGVLMGSATPWLVVILLVTLFDRHFIETEEQMLEQTFGEPFREYRKQVRRWI